jgi:hypothetical protein
VIQVSLPGDTSRDAVDDAALAVGLVLLNILPRTDTYPAQLVYVTPDRRASVHFVDAGAGAVAWVVRAEGYPAIEERWAGALRVAMTREAGAP